MSMTCEEIDDAELSELVEEFCEQKKLFCFEGNSGINKLKQLLSAIGYSRDSFDCEVYNFLQDNPGAIVAIIDWIKEQNVPDWKEYLQSEIVPQDDDDDGTES